MRFIVCSGCMNLFFIDPSYLVDLSSSNTDSLSSLYSLTHSTIDWHKQFPHFIGG
jgi:hypothetical protein